MTTETKELTEEEIARRAGIGERLRIGREEAARLRAEKAASAPPVLTSKVETETPQRPIRTMSEMDHFRADRTAAKVVDKMNIPEGMDGTSGDTAYSAPPLVRMYKLNRFGNYDPVNIPEGNVEMCWKAGYLDRCPDCGTADCGDSPLEQCTGRAPKPLRVCPVPSCGKRFYDEPLGEPKNAGSEDDPNLIRDDAYAVSTPQTRTKAMLDEHMSWYHPQESRSLAPHLIPGIIARQEAAKKA